MLATVKAAAMVLTTRRHVHLEPRVAGPLIRVTARRLARATRLPRRRALGTNAMERGTLARTEHLAALAREFPIAAGVAVTGAFRQGTVVSTIAVVHSQLVV